MPFITNTDGTHHVVASGLYVMATSPYASNFSTLYAAYAISSLPLLIVFVYATWGVRVRFERKIPVDFSIDLISTTTASSSGNSPVAFLE